MNALHDSLACRARNIKYSSWRINTKQFCKPFKKCTKNLETLPAPVNTVNVQNKLWQTAVVQDCLPHCNSPSSDSYRVYLRSIQSLKQNVWSRLSSYTCFFCSFLVLFFLNKSWYLQSMLCKGRNKAGEKNQLEFISKRQDLIGC